MIIINIPNLLTILRILLVPVYVMLVIEGRIHLGLVVFIIAGITDALDGFIAKRFSQRTEFGANIDPLADKFLLTAAFITLTYTGMLPLWLCALVIIRDMVIVGGIVMLRWSGRVVEIVPTIAGKITTTLQIVTVILAMVVTEKDDTMFLATLILTALFTLYTGFEYVWREIRIQTGRDGA